jgi:2-dehydro-3-deoxyglucarate aldolase/4-hydroxy-2-oxoheptanedioate aldolase
MNTNSTKRQLQNGEVSLGTFAFEFSTNGIARLAAQAGAEFLIFDMEHTGWSIETIRRLIGATPRDQIVPMVRIPATEYHFIARVLDMESMGIMAPMVESPAQAERLAQAAKYPPVGRRGAAFTIAHDDYAGGNVVDKMKTANDEVLLLAQIETVAGLECVEEIAAVDGIDVLWIGQFDLSTSMGIPGQFDHPDFQKAMDRVVAAANKHQKAAGYMVLNVDDAEARIAQGFRCISYNGDLWLYQAALREGLTAVRDAEKRLRSSVS